MTDVFLPLGLSAGCSCPRTILPPDLLLAGFWWHTDLESHALGGDPAKCSHPLPHSVLFTNPPLLTFPWHLALWITSCSIKLLTFVHLAFSQSKECTNAFEFLICFLFCLFLCRKAFQYWQDPFHLLKMQNHCVAVIDFFIFFFGFHLIKFVQRMRKALYHPREKRVSHTWLQSLWVTTSLRQRQA